MQTLTMTIEQVCESLGCKRTRVFQLLRDGTLDRAPRFGRSLRIMSESVERAVRGPQKSNPKRLRAVGAAPVAQRSEIKW